jgi:hypothetical protein
MTPKPPLSATRHQPTTAVASPYPDRQSLAAGLAAVLAAALGNRATVAIVRRRSNDYESTAPSEVVTCRLADQSRYRLFCKYSSDFSNRDHGHRGGVPYEAEVYRRVLQPAHVSTPRFYGTRHDRATGKLWCVLEYLDRSMPLEMWGDDEWLKRATTWIARFHAAQEARCGRKTLAFLHRYDAGYYRAWARRAVRAAERLGPRFAWLRTLAERFGKAAVPLLLATPTVIHGEYYPLNILVRQGVIYPIDWESTAVAAGEIDLASLTEGWPDELAEKCAQLYGQTRWPHGAPPDFARRLEAARLYLGWRWLANTGDHPLGEEELWYLEHLQASGRRLGWI